MTPPPLPNLWPQSAKYQPRKARQTTPSTNGSSMPQHAAASQNILGDRWCLPVTGICHMSHVTPGGGGGVHGGGGRANWHPPYDQS